jgi:hypothetical protein
MNNKTLALVAGLVLAGGAMVGASSAEAYRGDASVKGPNYSPERHAAMTKAFETKDYTAWKNLMQGKGRVTQVINKDNFAKFAEAHKLSLQGKKADAEKIRKELGLGQKDGSGQGRGKGQGAGRGMGRK